MGISTQVMSQSAGVNNHAILVFATDAVAAADTIFNFGFKPRYVKFENITDRPCSEYWVGMASTNTIDTAAGGVRTLGTSSSIVVNADNTVTVKAGLMVASKSFVMTAIG